MKVNRKTHKIASVVASVLMTSVIVVSDFGIAQAQEISFPINIEKPKITQISQDQLINGCIKIEPLVP